jgi:hypothetical protein
MHLLTTVRVATACNHSPLPLHQAHAEGMLVHVRKPSHTKIVVCMCVCVCVCAQPLFFFLQSPPVPRIAPLPPLRTSDALAAAKADRVSPMRRDQQVVSMLLFRCGCRGREGFSPSGSRPRVRQTFFALLQHCALLLFVSPICFIEEEQQQQQQQQLTDDGSE